MPRYHKDIGFPEHMRPIPRTLILTLSLHVQERLQRYAYPPRLPRVIDTTCAELVTADVDSDGAVGACLFRLPYSPMSDLSLVVDVSTGLIITAYKNRKDDHHESLDRSRYAAPTMSKLSLDA